MSSGDAQRTWFPEMIVRLRSEWKLRRWTNDEPFVLCVHALPSDSDEVRPVRCAAAMSITSGLSVILQLWRNVFRILLLIPTISVIRGGRQRVAGCGISATKEVKQSRENDENY